MKSFHFEFLRSTHPAMADLGAFVERYTQSDPASALVKLRILIEEIVADIYATQGLACEQGATFNERLTNLDFAKLVPRAVRNRMHLARKAGNRAAHGETASHHDVEDAAVDGLDVAGWFYLTYCDGDRTSIPRFDPKQLVDRLETTKGQLRRERRNLLQHIAGIETELEVALHTAEVLRVTAASQATTTAADREAAQERGTTNADTLGLSEEQTRKRIIDRALSYVGWNVESEEQVTLEEEVDGQPTPTGIGYADYVLWSDAGKPMAVIEAKRTAVSPLAGQEQARLYADSLENQHGQRPIIFLSNGMETWIWDDATGGPMRKLYGFYSKDSLEYLLHKRSHKHELSQLKPAMEIAGRTYQLEAIRRVTERFADNHRKALLVQATGTGKTRVAIALCELLLRAGWAKRILFLCDRRELRKQADQTFKNFLSSEPRTVVSRATAKDRNKRIYLATYPAMMQCFESFDVGFFDLIIADESHRSIYNKYRDLFLYFDALQLGLTATPVKKIDRNTYQLFRCDTGVPTAHYDLETAINAGFLVGPKVQAVTTRFQRDGVKYVELSEAEQAELEAQIAAADQFDFQASAIDRQIFNKGTTREVLRNLMDHGIRDAQGSGPGKSIIFARSHRHADHIWKVFHDLYGNYDAEFCSIIHNKTPRVDSVIDRFKDPNGPIRIAISVDMLDTGIDIPELVNLVFAKPVGSYVKFWQMIGRGTRLCLNLFGPGQHKTEFRIFDHWHNFEQFGVDYKEPPSTREKALLERVLEARCKASLTATDQMNADALSVLATLIEQQIEQLKACRAITVRDYWRDLSALGKREVLQAYAPQTHEALLMRVAPLMRWVDIRNEDAAYRFDLLITELQEAVLRNCGSVADLKGKLLANLENLARTLNPVRAKWETINEVKSERFWAAVTFEALEEARMALRGIMRHRIRSVQADLSPLVIDLEDREVERRDVIPCYEGQELVLYKQRVESVLNERFARDPVLRKVRNGQPVSAAEFDELSGKVMHVDPLIQLKNLPIHINIKTDMQQALRSVVGFDRKAVQPAFDAFAAAHPELTAQQLRFVDLLKTQIIRHGGLKLECLYEPPFTHLSAESIDGIFADNETTADELIELIETFNQPAVQGIAT
jgi:type I restriction enzyme R subunit